jgi:hypothetical protein
MEEESAKIAVDQIPKIRLRLSNDSSRITAQVIILNDSGNITPISPNGHYSYDEFSESSEQFRNVRLSQSSDSTPILDFSTRPISRTKKYDETRLANALDDIKKGMSARSAAVKWDVPRMTLQNRKKAGFREVMRRGPSKGGATVGDQWPPPHFLRWRGQGHLWPPHFLNRKCLKSNQAACQI